jgi:UDP-glucose 6-dehydrogenase
MIRTGLKYANADLSACGYCTPKERVEHLQAAQVNVAKALVEAIEELQESEKPK